jgi:hypothetical protein
MGTIGRLGSKTCQQYSGLDVYRCACDVSTHSGSGLGDGVLNECFLVNHGSLKNNRLASTKKSEGLAWRTPKFIREETALQAGLRKGGLRATIA